MALLIVLLSPPQSSGVCICELCLVKFLFFSSIFPVVLFPLCAVRERCGVIQHVK